MINEAAILKEPKGSLAITEIALPEIEDDEILVKNESIAIQPLDASIRTFAYFPMDYPAILGCNLAGTVVRVGKDVHRFSPGDKVVSDTPAYVTKAGRNGAWQKFVACKAATTCVIPRGKTFHEAVSMSFSLLTAVAALSLNLGMESPSQGGQGQVLIWGASGSVGGYAVQYCRSVGYTVTATASTPKFDYVRNLGATNVLDYKDENIVAKLRSLAPFDYIMCAVADNAAVNAIGQIMQPVGGQFIHVRPQNDTMDLPDNVELVYKSFSLTTQRPENPEFRTWWYEEYLPTAIAGSIQPTPVERLPGGLRGLDAGCAKILAGVSSKKLILDVWDS